MGFEDAELKFQGTQLDVIRERGILKPDEEVEAVATLWKYPMSISILGPWARIWQKRYLLAVTDKRVVLVTVPAFLVHASGNYPFVSANRPCEIKMVSPPQRQHQNGNIVILPEQLAELVGRAKVRLIWGFMGQKAFDLAARTPGAAPSALQNIGDAVD